jgi:flagellar hook-basal body complex protein FliE
MNAVGPVFPALNHVDGLRDVPAAPTSAGGLPSFGNVLEDLVASTNARANTANQMSAAFAAGTRDDIHGTMIAMSKADIELRFVGAVRNKVIDAFYELWRMQL